jgi:hypothetical protein
LISRNLDRRFRLEPANERFRFGRGTPEPRPDLDSADDSNLSRGALSDGNASGAGPDIELDRPIDFERSLERACDALRPSFEPSGREQARKTHRHRSR